MLFSFSHAIRHDRSWYRVSSESTHKPVDLNYYYYHCQTYSKGAQAHTHLNNTSCIVVSGQTFDTLYFIEYIEVNSTIHRTHKAHWGHTEHASRAYTIFSTCCVCVDIQSEHNGFARVCLCAVRAECIPCGVCLLNSTSVTCLFHPKWK